MNGNVRIDNERLEFLGDAILDAVTADYLFRVFPVRDEGFLTEMRSKIVSRTQLSRLAQKMALDSLIVLDASAGSQFRTTLGNALEALIGAIYVDKGYDFTRKILLERIIKQHLNIDELIHQEVNFKSKIIEWAQREKKQAQFRIAEEPGTGRRKHYVVELIVDGTCISKGIGFSIKGAEQHAAEKGWSSISGSGNP
jgi:ribonuclease-3